jgi:putative ABC transport system permease protein
LLGLTSYDTALRKKEVGVRKVLGASIPDLLLLLSRDLIKLLAIAYGIALPLAYVLATAWLIEYTFHTGIEMWMLMIPVFILLLVRHSKNNCTACHK